jgi:two-component system CheB/CheR fusion protein
MKVLEAAHLLPIKKNYVYVIPPNKNIAIHDGVMTLNTRNARPALNMPVDEFFKSLSEKHKNGAIGIVLSGNANDGTQGLKAIKQAGGLTYAQDDSAKFKGMPRSAIASGAVDKVLSPLNIARELERISKNTDIVRLAMQDTPDKEIDNADENLIAILQLLKKATGVDFMHYKMNTIKRRMVRRMILYKLDSLNDYLQYLRQHVSEIDLLYQDLLINVTYFFRDPDALEYISKSLLPSIIKSKRSNEPIRIWIPACSTGEEAYSLAILIIEVLGDKAASIPVQLFATDISELAIAKARLGIYSKEEVQQIAPKRLQKYFVKVDGSYRIVKAIRDLCVFASHNIFKDPPFSRLDIISCCNLMIYLDTVLQKKVLAMFHYALNEEGILILGKSETAGTSTHLFSQMEKKYKVYKRKKNSSGKALLEMSYRLPDTERSVGVGINKNKSREVSTAPDLEEALENILLTKYVPACVIINKELDILLSHGPTGVFLELPTGRASLNLLKMAHPDLVFELRNIIHKAIKGGIALKKSGLEIKRQNKIQYISIEVEPMQLHDDERLFLVVFEAAPEPVKVDSKPAYSKDKLVTQLQQELSAIKDDMRSILEEQEASVEELQSANEEIVSSNEELQSINEELETSKEEVESANEELITINTELQVRNEQLAESYEYAEAVFNTIGESVLILDHELRVKTANQSFYKTFSVKEEDTEGVSIYELGNHQWDIPRLRGLLNDIVHQNVRFEGFEVRHSFPRIGEKIMLLNARKIVQKKNNLQQLILIAIKDITEHKKAEEIIANRETWFRNMADNAPVMIWITGPDLHINFVNNTWVAYTGRNFNYQKEYNWVQDIHPDELTATRQLFKKNMEERKMFLAEFRLRRYDGEYHWIYYVGKPVFSQEGIFNGYIGSGTDINDKKMLNTELELRVEERTQNLEVANLELNRSNEELKQFAYVASHDLQEPLRKIMTFSDQLKLLKEPLSFKAVTLIEKINTSSERMSMLIDNLLNFSRISKSVKKYSTIDLNEVFKKVIPDFELILKQKKGTIRSNKLPVIQAIPVQMEQLFHNLISNGLKFSKENTPPRITVQANKIAENEVEGYMVLDRKATWYKIVFKDNGIGFDNEYAEQIFIIFQRLHDDSSISGTGIGLALCRKIVENHGGIITAHSEENHGAEFHILLPATQRSPAS